MRTKEKGLLIDTVKTHKSLRIVPIPKEVAIHLRLHRMKQRHIRNIAGEHFQNRNLVFCTTKGTLIIPRNFTRKFYALREKANLPKDINLHALRHTYATRLLKRGESIKTIQNLLGHADISTRGNIYTDVLPEIKRKAAANIDDLLKRRSPHS